MVKTFFFFNIQNEYETERILKQRCLLSMKCCGYASVGDRAVPKSCSITSGVTIGCKESIKAFIQINHRYLLIGAIVIMSIQVNELVYISLFGFIY